MNNIFKNNKDNDAKAKDAEHKHEPEQKKESKIHEAMDKNSEIEVLRKELETEKTKAQECYDKFLRLNAEFDNARKRMQREKQEFIKYANEGVLFELLNILDDLERSVEARETNHQDPEAFLKGIEMILSHLYELLKNNEVKPIDAKGKIFDPAKHEALMQVENNELPEHTIVEELQKGYMLEDRVIRTSKVKVSKKPDDRGQIAEDRK